MSPKQEDAQSETERQTDFTEHKEVLSLYIDTAKTFLGLSTGALALTVTFREKIACPGGGCDVRWTMIVSWLCYLAAVGFSALYQYFAVKNVDSFSRHPGDKGPIEYLVDNPGYIYGLMMASFFLGSLFLVIAAAPDLF